MRKHKQQPFSLQALARYLAVSERTVIRRFHHALDTTPTGYAQLLKIEVAKRLLETSTLNLDAISERIGYGDLSSFRRLFKREAGLSPAEYRQQFGRHQKNRSKVPVSVD
jgi:transcriptional regulator GlxA family with amidase domain